MRDGVGGVGEDKVNADAAALAIAIFSVLLRGSARQIQIDMVPYLVEPVLSNRALKTTVQPRHPALNVLPEPMRVGSFLMKMARAFKQPGEALYSRFPLPPKPHLTTNFRSSRYGDVFAETRKPTPPY